MVCAASGVSTGVTSAPQYRRTLHDQRAAILVAVHDQGVDSAEGIRREERPRPMLYCLCNGAAKSERFTVGASYAQLAAYAPQACTRLSFNGLGNAAGGGLVPAVE